MSKSLRLGTRRVRSCPAASLYVVSAAELRLPASHRLWSEPAYFVFVHLNLLSSPAPIASEAYDPLWTSDVQCKLAIRSQNGQRTR